MKEKTKDMLENLRDYSATQTEILHDIKEEVKQLRISLAFVQLSCLLVLALHLVPLFIEFWRELNGK